ncbi:MAG: gliding motility-associated ABC transporter ATP-binding subunit GldA [Crocinitomicaceae bacterium]|jgi:ABC-2 type transport system ATP-binding protein|nr:gliding motility-associated ABC transporter ATP-binding subunit GldA [Crocinitomicaceae bacterium]MCF8411003.1 gliding motility-associated ABC transporter ATP-binding subunit GldA [Crocinitomicaceae bacterium]MCF8443757.1 gliding motility-associated ABC transporter ATP-binding subunit GldA [Crocinitomicaceae bacterium]
MSIEINNLFKYYGEQAAVKNVSFSIPKGQVVGFLGPNGAGKSTTMKIITGFIPASEGSVSVCGIPVDTNNLKTRQKIGYLPENNPLYTDMYVREYLEFVGRIYKIKNLKQRVNEMIDLVGLGVEQHKKIEALSKGYKQRVGLAQAIIHDPEVLILDEPTSGLDPNQLVEIRELIKNIGKEKTVLLSTHIMQEVEAICQRVLIIKQGVLVADNISSEIKYTDNKQTVFVEFNKTVSKTELQKIQGVQAVRKFEQGWLIEASELVDIRLNIAEFAQQNGILPLTLKLEAKSLEEYFKGLTKN